MRAATAVAPNCHARRGSTPIGRHRRDEHRIASRCSRISWTSGHLACSPEAGARPQGPGRRSSPSRTTSGSPSAGSARPTSSAGATGRRRCAGAPPAWWSRLASSSPRSDVHPHPRELRAALDAESPEPSHPPRRTRRSSQPDAHRAATEALRDSGRPRGRSRSLTWDGFSSASRSIPCLRISSPPLAGGYRHGSTPVHCLAGHCHRHPGTTSVAFVLAPISLVPVRCAWPQATGPVPVGAGLIPAAVGGRRGAALRRRRDRAPR